MTAAACGAGDIGDFGAALREIFACAGGLLDQVRRGIVGHAAARGPGGPWERHGRVRRGPGHWGGGFGGPWGAWWAGPPGPPPRGPKAGRGDVRAAILALLREGPLNGYQIMSEIAERSGGAWRPSPGAVYPSLSQLADEGLIVGTESAGRRTYSLTDAGREYIEQNPEMARGAWESSAQQEAWQAQHRLRCPQRVPDRTEEAHRHTEARLAQPLQSIPLLIALGQAQDHSCRGRDSHWARGGLWSVPVEQATESEGARPSSGTSSRIGGRPGADRP